jgi:hypothetical protein
MTESRSTTPAADATAVSPTRAPLRQVGGPSARWEGWIGFGSLLTLIVGAFSVIQGLLALLAPSFFVDHGGRILALDLAAWGWLHLVLGALMLIAGSSLLGGAEGWARGIAVGFVALNMLVQLVWLPAFPVWSVTIVALDLLVIYAIATTWVDWRTVG